MKSEADEAIEIAARAGLILDPWQELCLQTAMGVGDDDLWSAFEVGIIVPRQNGKGGALEARELAGLFVLGEQLIIHSAHEYKTAQEQFRRIMRLIEDSPDLEPLVKRVVRSHGEESIETRSGSILRFMPRTRGSGRGFTGDLVVLDEAFNLPAEVIAAMLPTLSARPNPQVWYTSTVPGSIDERTAKLREVAARARSDEPGALAWLEWSCDPDASPDDPDEWARANPALGYRITERFIEHELAALPPEAFAVERMGVWPEESVAARVIADAVWAAGTDPHSALGDDIGFAIDITPDRSSSTIAAAGVRDDGRWHVEVVDHRPGTGWVAERAIELWERWGTPIAVDKTGPAGSLLTDITSAGVEVLTPSANEHAQACGMFYDLAVSDRLRHLPDDRLDVALRGAAKRELGEAWAWSRKNSDTDISPLVAVTLAMWSATRPAAVEEPVFAF